MRIALITLMVSLLGLGAPDAWAAQAKKKPSHGSVKKKLAKKKAKRKGKRVAISIQNAMPRTLAPIEHEADRAPASAMLPMPDPADYPENPPPEPYADAKD